MATTATNPTHSDATEFANIIARKGALPLHSQLAVDMAFERVDAETANESVTFDTNPDASDAVVHNQVLTLKSTDGAGIAAAGLRLAWFPEGAGIGTDYTEWDDERTPGNQPELWFRGRCYVDWTGTITGGQGIEFLRFGEIVQNNRTDGRICSFKVQRNGSENRWAAFVNGGSNQESAAGVECPKGQWFDFEAYFKHESSDGADDGAIRLRVRSTSGSGSWITVFEDTSLGMIWATDLYRVVLCCVRSSGTALGATNPVVRYSHVEWSMDGTSWFDEPADTLHPGWVEDQGVACGDVSTSQAKIRLIALPDRFDFTTLTHYAVEYADNAGFTGSSKTAWASTAAFGDDPFFVTLSGLEAGTDYHYRLVLAEDDSGTNEIQTSARRFRTLHASHAPRELRLWQGQCVYQPFHFNDHDALYRTAMTGAFDLCVFLGDHFYDEDIFDATGEPSTAGEADWRRQWWRLAHAHGWRHLSDRNAVFHMGDDHCIGGDNSRVSNYFPNGVGTTTNAQRAALGDGHVTYGDQLSASYGIEQFVAWCADGFLNTVSGCDVDDLNFERVATPTPHTRFILDETRTENGNGAGRDLITAAHETWTKARMSETGYTFNVYVSPAYWSNFISNIAADPEENWAGHANSLAMRSEMEAIMAAKGGERWFVISGDRHTTYEITSLFFGSSARSSEDYGGAGTASGVNGSLVHCIAGGTLGSGRWFSDDQFKTYKASSTVGDFEDGVLAAFDIDDAGGIDGNELVRTGGMIITLDEENGTVSYSVLDADGDERLPAGGRGPFVTGVGVVGRRGTRSARNGRGRAALAAIN